MPDPYYLYLHGFASGPQSTKARHLQRFFNRRHHQLHRIDLNQDSFSRLTLSRMMEQVIAALPGNLPVTLIGSSLGGLAAAHVGEQTDAVGRLVLLAPAFDFLHYWLERIPAGQLNQWKATGSMEVYHYGAGRMVPLHYDFVEDAKQYGSGFLQRPVPTLILHGRHDQTIPIQASQKYAARRSWVELIELDSDHALIDVLPDIIQAIARFCFATPAEIGGQRNN
jgi:pimeloyl-ACP methyl ester carboxylesterase